MTMTGFLDNGFLFWIVFKTVNNINFDQRITLKPVFMLPTQFPLLRAFALPLPHIKLHTLTVNPVFEPIF